MAKDARNSLQRFVGAIESHFAAVANRRGENDPTVERTYQLLEEAFLDYEEAIQDNFEEYLPFELVEEEE